jgi:branched-chain amino acid transport system permease protein
MEELSITIVHGIGIGAVYALVAMSLNVIYNATGILNFAQGDYVVVGGVLAFATFGATSGIGLWILLAIAVTIAVAVIMAVQGWLTLAPLRDSVEQHSWLVTTLAASSVIASLVLIIQGPAQIRVPNPLGSFDLLGVNHRFTYPLMFVVAIAVYLALRAFHARTLSGMAMSALRQDLDAARAAGAPVRRLQLLSFAIAGLMLGVIGFVASPVLGLTQASGIEFALNGFVVAIVGGLGNQKGAIIAGPLFGMLSVYSVFAVGGELQQAVTLAVLILLLVLRPEGIFGRPAARRV